jgi:hypothetical protein
MRFPSTPHPLARCGGSFRSLPVPAALALGFALAGCGRYGDRLEARDRAAGQASLAAEFLAAPRGPERARLVPTHSLTLRESSEVINVSPEVVADPRGGYLVSDDREAQVRRYAPDGTLLWHAGRRGGGPGEFAAPTAVVRLRSGEVAVFDRMGKVAVFDSAGAAVVRTFRTGLRLVSDAAVLDDSTVLVAALGNDDLGPRLHLLDPATGRVRAGFFTPMARSPYRAAAAIADWTKVSVRNGIVAAIFATSDTVYRFTATGRPLPSIPIPFAHWRPASRRLPGDANSNALARIRWFSSFDLVADVHWLPDGGLVVPYQHLDPDDGTTRHWHLLAMTAAGRRLHDLREQPRLLEVRGSTLVMLDPHGEAPNQWIEAHLPP